MKYFPFRIILQLTVYILIGSVTIFVSTVGYSAQLNCRELFENEAAFDTLAPLEQINVLKSLLNKSEDANNFLIDHGKHRNLNTMEKKLDEFELEEVVQFGRENDAIYRVVSLNLILKIHSELYEELTPERSFLKRLSGNYIGSLFKDVTEIVEFGTLITSDGKLQYYTLTKEIPFGDKKLILKDVALERDENNTSDFIKAVKANPFFIKQLVESYVTFLKVGVVPKDPDFAITRDNKVIWLDTDKWEIVSPQYSGEYGTNAYYFFNLLNKISVELGSEFKSELIQAVKNSNNLDARIKNSIIHNMRLREGLYD